MLLETPSSLCNHQLVQSVPGLACCRPRAAFPAPMKMCCHPRTSKKGFLHTPPCLQLYWLLEMLHPREENVIALNTSINSWEKFFFHPGVHDEEKLNNGKDGEIHGILKEKGVICVLVQSSRSFPPLSKRARLILDFFTGTVKYIMKSNKETGKTAKLVQQSG